MALLEIKNLQLDFVSHDGAPAPWMASHSRWRRAKRFASSARAVAARVSRRNPSRDSSQRRRLATRRVKFCSMVVTCLKMSEAELRSIRGGVVSYVFQDPSASLNPVFRVGAQIKEALKLHRPDHANDAEVIRLLKLVGIPAPESRLKNYPFEMSGGMQQRVMIAMALASEPKLLVADEPTTALDVTIQAQILDLLRDLKQRLGMAILLITHNLGIVGDIADRVAVMYAGQIVELAPARGVVATPAASLHEGADGQRAETARRRAAVDRDSRQRAAHRKFPGGLSLCAALCAGSAGMPDFRPGIARDPGGALGAVSLGRPSCGRSGGRSWRT
jgi:ABC-type glutathione transport system ATPase component